MRPSQAMFVLDDNGTRCFGPGPCRLLQAVQTTGSLRSAAISMGMAYTKAIRMLKVAERSMGVNLTSRTIGGSGGGGSRLTPEALDLLERYERWSAACRGFGTRSFDECFDGFGAGAAAKDVSDDASRGRIGVVVMASGLASRFGSNKLVAPLAGTPVLERTLRSLPLDLVDPVVVTRWREVQDLCDRLGVRSIRHELPLQSDTVRMGLSLDAGWDGCMFVTGDQPLLGERSVRSLVRAFREDPTRVVRLAWQGKAGGPVLFPASCFEGLRGLEGDVGGTGLLKKDPELARRIRLVEAERPEELEDVDTPDELARLESLVRGE